MSNKIPLWVKYIVNDLFEVKPGTYKVKGQYAKDNLREFHGWCVKMDPLKADISKMKPGFILHSKKTPFKSLKVWGLNTVLYK